MLANRLRKNLARLQPWAKREHLEAWRVYDRDVPERPWSIDLYGDHAVASEYVTPVARREQPGQREAERQDVLDAIAEVLGVPGERVHLKTRERHRSVEREGHGDPSHELPVSERGHRFLVNLDDYLDTGLFLDHREARRRVGQASRGQRVLNLFCYTGSFTVYAAAGGATATVSVDLSPVYLAWAERNLALNGLKQPQHTLVKADVVEYLRQTPDRFDVIVLDPPTVSRSRQGRSFDVQKDHVELINLALGRLSEEGWLLFSTNFRQFSLQTEALRASDIREISRETASRDFREQTRRVWEVRCRADGRRHEQGGSTAQQVHRRPTDAGR